MNTKLKSNGFGSFHKHLIFTINNEHSQKLIDEGWEEIENTASFRVDTTLTTHHVSLVQSNLEIGSRSILKF